MSKILIAYFSHKGMNYVAGSIKELTVGNTAIAAETAAKLTGGEMFEIVPAEKYPFEYTPCTDVAQEELRANARPEIVTHVENMENFDTVILGYPSWWGTMPMAVFTFLEEYDFSGKTIYPFCTNEGSGLGRSEQDIKTLCPAAKVVHGLSIRGAAVKSSGEAIEKWLKELI